MKRKLIAYLLLLCAPLSAIQKPTGHTSGFTAPASSPVDSPPGSPQRFPTNSEVSVDDLNLGEDLDTDTPPTPATNKSFTYPTAAQHSHWGTFIGMGTGVAAGMILMKAKQRGTDKLPTKNKAPRK
jgi:hypothetical protein